MSSTDARVIVLVRVAINDSLFVLCAVSLSLCLYKIAKMSLANIYLESKVRNGCFFLQSVTWLSSCPSKFGPGFHSCSSPPSLQGTSVCQVTVVGATVILLYTSRACYNLVVLALANKSINSFDYDWYNVSDQVSHQPGPVEPLLRFINLPDQSESLLNLLDLKVWLSAHRKLLIREVWLDKLSRAIRFVTALKLLLRHNTALISLAAAELTTYCSFSPWSSFVFLRAAWEGQSLFASRSAPSATL